MRAARGNRSRLPDYCLRTSEVACVRAVWVSGSRVADDGAAGLLVGDTLCATDSQKSVKLIEEGSRRSPQLGWGWRQDYRSGSNSR
jgi:hypothetical protein